MKDKTMKILAAKWVSQNLSKASAGEIISALEAYKAGYEQKTREMDETIRQNLILSSEILLLKNTRIYRRRALMKRALLEEIRNDSI